MKLYAIGVYHELSFHKILYRANTEKARFLPVSQSCPDHKFPVAFEEQISERFLLFKEHNYPQVALKEITPFFA
jgi:hypothetical protein